MVTAISKFLKKYSADVNKVNRLLVSAYISINKIDFCDGYFCQKYKISEVDGAEFGFLQSFIEVLLKSKVTFDLEDLMKLFEFVISPKNKIVNGAVYTPVYIRQNIVNRVLNRFKKEEPLNLKIADISCGCGGFFYTLTKELRKRYPLSCADIYNNIIYGVDVESYSIERTQIILSLYAYTEGESVLEVKFHLYRANSLGFNWNDVLSNSGFDAIIGNPPYVDSSKIGEESRSLLVNWSVADTGKADLYIPFFQIALENLKDDGMLAYITVNNFYRSLNGRALREYFSNNGYKINIIDFGSEQVFKGCSTYTCICEICKINVGQVGYIESCSRNIYKLKESDFTYFSYSQLDNSRGWLLKDAKAVGNIRKIENVGKPLFKFFQIRNGFATLRNKIYILKVESEDNNYFYNNYKGKIYPIEKGICRDVVKPNILKCEEDIETLEEKVIYPYAIYNHIVSLIPENQLKINYPQAYNYLNEMKEELANRDKGHKKHEAWYAWGRTQARHIPGYKLLFPYISNKPYFVYTNNESLLFYNGFALIDFEPKRLLVAQIILQSGLFWYYIKKTSKPYQNGFFAMEKNYVKNFGMPQLENQQINKLLSLKVQKEIDAYVCQLYGIDYDTIL